MRRGQIWRVDFGGPRGSGPAYIRPGLIISANALNDSNIRTVTLAAITTNLNWAKAPGNVFLPQGSGGVDENSVINVSHVGTIDKSHLLKQLGKLEEELMVQVDAGLRLILDL